MRVCLLNETTAIKCPSSILETALCSNQMLDNFFLLYYRAEKECARFLQKPIIHHEFRCDCYCCCQHHWYYGLTTEFNKYTNIQSMIFFLFSVWMNMTCLQKNQWYLIKTLGAGQRTRTNDLDFPAKMVYQMHCLHVFSYFLPQERNGKCVCAWVVSYTPTRYVKLYRVLNQCISRFLFLSFLLFTHSRLIHCSTKWLSIGTQTTEHRRNIHTYVCVRVYECGTNDSALVLCLFWHCWVSYFRRVVSFHAE